MSPAAATPPVIERIEAAGVVAVIRTPDATKLAPLIDALVDGGVHAIEITTTVPDVIAAIEAMAGRLPPHVILGAGTVLDAGTAVAAVAAGARFVVSPVFSPDVMDAARAVGAAVVPGCFSPTEIWTACRQGADAVKVFPATSLGPQYFKDLRAPMPQLRLIPTGGVSLDNAGAWIKAGAIALGVGTALVETAAVERGDWQAIRARARRFIAAVTEARS